MTFDSQKWRRKSRNVRVHMPECFLGQTAKRQPALNIEQCGIELRAPITRFFFELLQGSHFRLLSGASPASQRKTKPMGGGLLTSKVLATSAKTTTINKQSDSNSQACDRWTAHVGCQCRHAGLRQNHYCGEQDRKTGKGHAQPERIATQTKACFSLRQSEFRIDPALPIASEFFNKLREGWFRSRIVKWLGGWP